MSDPAKPCTHCRAVLPLDAYYRDPRASDGRQSRCKRCHLKRQTTSRYDACHCGARKLRTRAECADCARALPAERPRCQAVGCLLPVRGDARGCALHWPSFEREGPSLAEYATARGAIEW